jgi:hypothetical protein
VRTLQTDILVRSPDGSNIAVVEVKNRKNLSRDIATIVRRNMLEDGLSSQAPFFLLLSQDKGFLWNGAATGNSDAPPSYEFPMENVIARYENSANGTERLGEEYLELLVLRWLLDLGNMPQKADGEPEKSLAHSGFLQAIQGAMVIADL